MLIMQPTPLYCMTESILRGAPLTLPHKHLRMKLFRITLLLTALCSASLVPSCGGGGDETGNQYVSVSAFKSGATGFSIIGSPIVWIESTGPVQGTGSLGSNPFPDISRPDDSDDQYIHTDGYVGTLEQWNNFAGDMADAEKGSSSCYVNVRISNSSDRQYSIDGVATYTAIGNLGYLHLYFDEVSGSNNNLEYAALIHFMGAVTQSDLTYSTDGDSSTSDGATTGSKQRYLITTLTGSELKFWFNFDTNQSMTELNYVASRKLVNTQTGVEFAEPARVQGIWRITHPFVRAQ